MLGLHALQSDPNKRRHYDLTGESPDDMELETVDMEVNGGNGLSYR